MKNAPHLAPCYRRFGSRIGELRINEGLTQKALGDLVGLSRISISNIENGQQRILLEDIDKFADALGIKPLDLMADLWK